MMSLPTFAPFPPQEVVRCLSPQDWESSVAAWNTLVQAYLCLPLQAFVQKASSDEAMWKFLLPYVENTSHDPSAFAAATSRDLQRSCFLLLHRTLRELSHPPESLLAWSVLADVATVYAGLAPLEKLMGDTWRTHHLEASPNIIEARQSMVLLLEATSAESSAGVDTCLRRVMALTRASEEYAHFLMTGSDLLDSFSKAWTAGSTALREKVVAIVYLALISLVEGRTPNVPLLLDHLYSLDTSAGQAATPTASTGLLSSLVSQTNFLERLEKNLLGSDAARAKSLVLHMHSLRAADGHRHKRARRRVAQGKQTERLDPQDEAHIHRVSLVAQIQDLFPDLESAFVMRLLDEYNDDTELITAHLLEKSLPPHLQAADRAARTPSPSSNLAPPTTRRNVFDHDAFDNLSVSPSQLHRGRRNPDLTADALLADRSSAPAKAAILSALAAFDSDDDERDDTYDTADIGGAIDRTTAAFADDPPATPHEDALFHAYQTTPQLFARDATTRRSQARVALRAQTGLTDEALEGWALMLGRDARKLAHLKRRFELSSATSQHELPATAYRAGDETAEDEAEASEPRAGSFRGGTRGQGRGQGRGRSRGRGATRGMARGGRGAGPAGERDAQLARRRKDADKGARANHNRRDGRARKLARAGFPE